MVVWYGWFPCYSASNGALIFFYQSHATCSAKYVHSIEIFREYDFIANNHLRTSASTADAQPIRSLECTRGLGRTWCAVQFSTVADVGLA
jgi:hypothetical protein